MHVDVFCYGTLRTDPLVLRDLRCDDETASDEGLLDMQLHWDPEAKLIGTLGGWRLPDRAIFCDGERHGVPAVSNWPVEGAHVVGDLYRVTLTGFADLLRYEGWPQLYEYEVLHVVSTSTPAVVQEAVVFTTSRADNFGAQLHTGDYFAPITKEVQCAE